MRTAIFFDGEGWREGVVLLDDDGRMLLRDEPSASRIPRLDGVIVGGFTDHHVHLQLVEQELLAQSRLGRVVDLGGDPGVMTVLAEGARATRIEYAGAFLTPVGGYPSDRDWAPDGSVRQIVNEASSTSAAADAVAEMADAGASCIKVASNRTAGPVFDDIVFRAIVEAASAHGLPVVAHAEGRDEAQRVARLGAATLAHAPFTERLDDEEIAEQAASVTWISTLAIHGGADLHVALDNVRRFHAAGGRVLYGTDMGNGPTPVDLNPLELAALRDAGLDGPALRGALAPRDPRDPASVLLLLPHRDADPTHARRLTAADLEA
ncbi:MULTISPECIES: amidohydrolase family protein [unclassified Microbacterium]|uniref:amidohydrolase family protein n=1 Tax=unclassified Microbacterium TaxID=2609290 RepID=UPI003412E7C9